MTEAKNQKSFVKNEPVQAAGSTPTQKPDLKTAPSEGMPGKTVASENKTQKKVEKIATPLTQGVGEKLFKIEDLTTNLTPKKIVKLGSILVLLILIVAALYVKFVRKTPVNEPIHLLNAPTPSSFSYQKYKPSIYADDANFKKIDEGVSVLDNEIKNIQLEEKEILPPTLDFKIEFE